MTVNDFLNYYDKSDLHSLIFRAEEDIRTEDLRNGSSVRLPGRQLPHQRRGGARQI